MVVSSDTGVVAARVVIVGSVCMLLLDSDCLDNCYGPDNAYY